MCAYFSFKEITHAPTWRQGLAFFVSLTVTKESAPTMDRPHLHIISSNPLSSITWPQMINSNLRDLNKQKYLSGPNFSGNRIINSFVRARIGWSAVSTGILPRFKVLIVFDDIHMVILHIKVWAFSSIGGKMAYMSGSCITDRCFTVWCLAQGTQ